MRAAVLEALNEPLVVSSDVEIAPPAPDQVKVRVSHCGICHSDLSMTTGAFPAPVPIILGHEAAGVVEEVGSHVKGLAPGDSVVLTPCPPCGTCYWCVRAEAAHCVNTAGIGTNAFPDGSTGLSRGGQSIWRGLNLAAFSEYVVLNEHGAVKIPSEVPREVACVIGCAVQTGVGAVFNTARVVEGATVLVMGLGGIGLSTLQGARIAGASRIIASDPVSERRDVAKALGATDLIDPGSENTAERAREITGGVGVDYAFEAAGVGALIREAYQATRNGGTIVCVGAPPLSENLDLGPAAAFVVSGKRVLGTVLGGSNSLREIPRLVSLWQGGRLDLETLVSARRPLDEINQAMDDLKASRGIRTVLEI
jgi:S-(hydroxymethyl)glutathione dehydrogenase/alcohol dehydrogenase